jgi:rod shape determining protein RodA
MANERTSRFDWIIILLFLALVSIGWLNIYSASYVDNVESFFDLGNIYTKQLMWIVLSIVLIVFILAIDVKFYERFGSIIYIVSLISLLGLFVFGKSINGATSWYVFGPVSIQPSEFAKAAAALAVAMYVSDFVTYM